MRAGDAGGRIDAEHDRQAPAEIDAEVRPVGVLAQHRLRDDADAKRDQNERAQKFRGRFAAVPLNIGGLAFRAGRIIPTRPAYNG